MVTPGIDSCITANCYIRPDFSYMHVIQRPVLNNENYGPETLGIILRSMSGRPKFDILSNQLQYLHPVAVQLYI